MCLLTVIVQALFSVARMPSGPSIPLECFLRNFGIPLDPMRFQSRNDTSLGFGSEKLLQSL
ncbi:hypothetical protein D9758_003461 [Tetrapyrgos nigripes]|uniref:Uncharacterized protein n=1 Tax=Tetrapyrgos nigripes TaxID=182062 RepID=A0A8H5GV17_9AGAR|nr:hypothetical protein D9758_003461 [Tetrapyrgos nigripes]